MHVLDHVLSVSDEEVSHMMVPKQDHVERAVRVRCCGFRVLYALCSIVLSTPMWGVAAQGHIIELTLV